MWKKNIKKKIIESKIDSIENLVELLSSNKIDPTKITYKPLRDKIENFIEIGNELIKEDNLNLPKLSLDNLYFKWDGDEDWLTFYPYLKDSKYDDSEDFIRLLEMCWNESEGGDGVVINEYGLLIEDGEIEELNLLENSVKDNVKVILDKDLTSIFGLTSKDFL